MPGRLIATVWEEEETTLGARSKTPVTETFRRFWRKHSNFHTLWGKRPPPFSVKKFPLTFWENLVRGWGF